MPHTHAKNSDFNACHWYWINEVFSFHIFPAVFRNALSWPCLFPKLFFKQSFVRKTKKNCCTWFSLLNNAQYPAMFSKLVLIKILVVWTRKHCFWLAKITSSEALNVVCFQRNLNRVFLNYSRVLSSSETKGQSVGPGEKALRKFSSTGGNILGDPRAVSRAGRKGATKVFEHRLKSLWVPTLTGPFPNCQANADSWLGTKMLCIIVPNLRIEQHLLSSFHEFVHDGYHQAFLTRKEGTIDESKNVSDAISRSNSICTEKILFLIVWETYPYPYHNVS